MSLPIWQIHEPIVKAMRDGSRLVLVAPTGSGKTTQVPQMLLDSGIFRGRIVVLQPRRVAARTVAARVAWERHAQLGGEVGYQIRFEDRTSLGTRICYVTEGILLRWLQDDSNLQGIDAILFDEFHERNLLSDVALALAKRLQETRRPDLRLIVMSATLEAEPVAKYLGDCPVLISEGKAFPVDIRHIACQDERPVSDQAADIAAQIVRSGDPGDILIFMPGMGEINATINATRAAAGSDRLALIPLHGELPPEEQDRAFAPNPFRKIVVATNVAETSVTIDGIVHVIDSGQARVARYDPERGIGTLFIEPISRASADQRAGRAGRTAPGVCHRLWTESGHLNRPARNTPEIQRSDLAEVVLLLHSLGITDAARFDWLDRPDPQAVERSEQLLRTLGALRSNPAGQERSDMTPIGWEMLRLPMHPRYSRMLVEAARRNCVPAAALCAALVSGRDLLARLGRDDKHIAEARELFEASAESDFYTLMRAHQFARNNHFNTEQCRRYGVHAQIARQVQQTFEQIVQVAGGEKNAPPPADDALARCLTAGFIDQLCRRRDQGTLDCDVVGGRTGTLARESVAQNTALFVAASIREVSGRMGNLTLLGLATAVKREWIQEMFPDQISISIEHLFDRTHKRVSAIKLERFHDLLLHHEHQREVDPPASGNCLAEAYGRQYFELPLFNHELKQTIARINLVSAVLPELELAPADRPYVTGFLARAFAGLTLVKEAQATPLLDLFTQHYGKERLEWLNELAPLTVTWPDGRKLKLLYPEEPRDDDGEPNSPELQVKLHECFALKEHPHICEGKLPVKLWLATPDGKRLESTFNWPAFKANAYPKLKPALQKKFPGFLWV
ncbi:MAG TPA: ATP-dependent helicase HrpB [Verrucomicrobiae bacterium]|jgi:ATP-dependent helicase HrpB|nr:ATP-dependent helicase HrpB [Verrucomicrobiae bacterium]